MTRKLTPSISHTNRPEFTPRPLLVSHNPPFDDLLELNGDGLRREPLAVRKATLETTVRAAPRRRTSKRAVLAPTAASARTLCAHDPHFSTHEELFSRKDRLGWACNPRPRWSGGSRITGCCRPDWDRGGREPNRQSFRRGIHGLCSRRASHSARSSSDHGAELYGFMCARNHYGRDRHRWDAAERSAIRTATS